MIAGHLALADFFVRVYLVRRPLAANTEYQYRRSIDHFSAWLGRPARCNDLSDDLVSRWIADSHTQLAPRTLAGRRGDILCLWRLAAQCGYCGPPGQVRAVRVPRPIPRAWTIAELRRILAACDSIPGYFGNGIPRRLYLRALIEVAYQTGLRRDDLWRLRLDDIGPDGILAHVQGKTLVGHVSAIQPATLESLVRIHQRLTDDGDPHAKTPLRWPHTPRAIYYWLDKLCQAAGVAAGGLQQLRRTGATACEAAQPGSAARFLGHRSPGMAERHYLDRRQLRQIVSPPSL